MGSDLIDSDGSGGSDRPGASVELLWIPLGSGERVVRASGKIFEALSALVQRRRRCDLYHSALVITLPDDRFVIEVGPIGDGDGAGRGVVAEGPVGTRLAGRFRLFRYEVRRWRDGSIPDAGDAVSTERIAIEAVDARRILDLVPTVPTPVWGRDELRAGEMWNSNSVVAWLLSCGGVDTGTVGPPSGGRAPGWDAGITVAHRPNPVVRPQG